MDISTGHAILAYLQDHQRDGDQLDRDWHTTLHGYTNPNATRYMAALNLNKIRHTAILPYDENLISLGENKFINASAIHDSDPRHVSYIATQSPMEETISDFWQMIWEQGCVVIVNLEEDNAQSRYWPASGSLVCGGFEVHLVSEHIWSECYLVRSFYLKNLNSSETRTVTQFHFVCWPENGCPPSTKSMLEFRRKVNKSYRGRASPVLVHCSDGYGRTGAYCLLDMTLNRINKGVKEMNTAATVEHLRDQRPAMVANLEQYKFVLSCVADEVSALLKSMP